MMGTGDQRRPRWPVCVVALGVLVSLCTLACRAGPLVKPETFSMTK